MRASPPFYQSKYCAILSLLGIACLLMPIGHSYAQVQSELRKAATTLTKALVTDSDVAKLTGQRIFIAEFENVNGKGDAVPRILQGMLTTAIINAKHFKVVERAQLDKALKELKLGISDIADPDNAKKIGRIVGAAYVLLGSIADANGTVTIDARIVSIEDSVSIAAAEAEIPVGPIAGAPGDANPTNTPEKVGTTVNLNEERVTSSAGQLLRKPRDFGLTGPTRFRIAWREKLEPKGEFSYPKSFSAGDILGDRSSRLVTMKWQ